MNIGFAMCGSFCTFDSVFPVMEAIAKTDTVIPIFSFAAGSIDSRFGTAQNHLQRATEICGRSPLDSIAAVEPIGPKKLLDALVIAPCTGNTLAKIAQGITDTSVTMAAKAHMRAGRPLVIALASNDALSANLSNIATLLSRKSVYFVPLLQDDPKGKPHSLVACLERTPEALEAAMEGRQLSPLFL